MRLLTKMMTLGIASLMIVSCSDNSSAPELKEPLAPPSETLAALSGFAGQYIIVDARRASDVSLPAQPGLEIPIGKSVNFTRNGIEMEGASCDDWRIDRADGPIVIVESDPNLVDIRLGPNDGPNSAGDQQVHAGFEMICDGEPFGLLHKVDDRVLVMPWANSAINLILEKPLPTTRIKAYQAQLKSMKFYDGALTGELDDATLRASRAWYEYRANLNETQPIPARPAMTENLFDGLRVLE